MADTETTKYRTSKEALADLERAIEEVVQKAEATLGGVGFACFMTMKEQDQAIAKARAKLHEARALSAAITKFKDEHGDFN